MFDESFNTIYEKLCYTLHEYASLSGTGNNMIKKV